MLKPIFIIPFCCYITVCCTYFGSHQEDAYQLQDAYLSKNHFDSSIRLNIELNFAIQFLSYARITPELVYSWVYFWVYSWVY